MADDNAPENSGTGENIPPTPTTETNPNTPPTTSGNTGTSQPVKVDLSELRQALEGLPERVADFIKEAVVTPKAATRQNSESGSGATGTANDTDKRPASRGWLADFLFKGK